MQQNQNTAIYDGFYAHKMGQPRPSIWSFKSSWIGLTIPRSSLIWRLFPLSELTHTTTEVYFSQDNALDKLRSLLSYLSNFLVGLMAPNHSTGAYTPDGMVFKEVGCHVVPLLTVEYERTFGKGGGPPTLASFSVRRVLTPDLVCGFREFTHLR